MEPHEHGYFDKYGWTDNLCRKVDHDAPWCYTTDPDKRWEECDCNQIDGKYEFIDSFAQNSFLFSRNVKILSRFESGIRNKSGFSLNESEK